MRITVQGVSLFYQCIGSGTIPVILLHGNGEDHTIFDRLVGRLAKKYTVYSIDSRCHGQSSHTRALSYRLMAEDIYAFIKELRLFRPILYGFSDGGIVGLILAMRHPDLLSRLIVSGANLSPKGLSPGFVFGCKARWKMTRSPYLRMMAYEPDLDPGKLKAISIPVLVFAGQKDIVRTEHTRLIASSLKNSTLRILPGENHSSYIVHSEKLYGLIKDFLP